MKSYITAAMLMLASIACSATDEETDESYSFVLSADYIPVVLSAVHYEGLSDNDKFQIDLRSDSRGSAIHVKLGNGAGRLKSKSSALPAGIALETVSINKRSNIDRRGNILLTFHYGEPVSKCHLTINNLPLSYGLLTIFGDGSYQLIKHEIRSDCSISEDLLESGKLD